MNRLDQLNFQFADDISNPGNNRTDVIILIESDGTKKWVPNDSNNTNWQEYQEWLDLGNIPLDAE